VRPSWLPIIAITLCMSTPALAEEVTLRIGYSDKESTIFLAGNGAAIPALPGIAVEMTQNAVKACEAVADLGRYPGNRLLARLEDNSLDAVVMLSFSADRAKIASYPMKDGAADSDFRISTLTYAFYTRADAAISWNGKTFTGLQRPIGTILGWSITADLEKMGLPVEPARDTQNNFNKLLGERIDAFAIQTSIGDAYLTAHDLTAKVKELAPPISSKPYFLVFSHAFQSAHPGLADCLWQSIAAQREAEMADFLARYHGAMN
jgi:polar amino acid transport system substrate-binding protein